MADTVLHRLFAPAPPRADARTAPAPRQRPRGPVLIGDLLSAPGGRPLLLSHWDAADEPD